MPWALSVVTITSHDQCADGGGYMIGSDDTLIRFYNPADALGDVMPITDAPVTITAPLVPAIPFQSCPISS